MHMMNKKTHLFYSLLIVSTYRQISEASMRTLMQPVATAMKKITPKQAAGAVLAGGLSYIGYKAICSEAGKKKIKAVT